MNDFATWVDIRTAGRSGKDKSNYKRQLACKFKITTTVFNNWYRGITEPSELEKIAVNKILKEKVFNV